jgi:hypothetical protein
MDFNYRVVDAGRFVQVDASGKVDVPATVRMAQEIAAFHGEAAHLPVLLDVRQLQGRLSILDIVQIVKTLVADSGHYRRKLALLARADDQLERARFMQIYSLNRGIPIAAFADRGEAVKWLAEP